MLSDRPPLSLFVGAPRRTRGCCCGPTRSRPSSRGRAPRRPRGRGELSAAGPPPAGALGRRRGGGRALVARRRRQPLADVRVPLVRALRDGARCRRSSARLMRARAAEAASCSSACAHAASRCSSRRWQHVLIPPPAAPLYACAPASRREPARWGAGLLHSCPVSSATLARSPSVVSSFSPPAPARECRGRECARPLPPPREARPFIIGVPAERLDELRALPLGRALRRPRPARSTWARRRGRAAGGARDGGRATLPPSMVSRADARARAADSVHHALRLQRRGRSSGPSPRSRSARAHAAFTLYADPGAPPGRGAAGAGAAGAARAWHAPADGGGGGGGGGAAGGPRASRRRRRRQGESLRRARRRGRPPDKGARAAGGGGKLAGASRRRGGRPRRGQVVATAPRPVARRGRARARRRPLRRPAGRSAAGAAAAAAAARAASSTPTASASDEGLAKEALLVLRRGPADPEQVASLPPAPPRARSARAAARAVDRAAARRLRRAARRATARAARVPRRVRRARCSGLQSERAAEVGGARAAAVSRTPHVLRMLHPALSPPATPAGRRPRCSRRRARQHGALLRRRELLEQTPGAQFAINYAVRAPGRPGFALPFF